MFGWFKKPGQEPLVFPDNQSAFDYACRNLENRILLEAVIPALVVKQGDRGGEGERYFLVRLAGSEGGREVWACTLKEATDYPEPGDLIGYRVVRYDPDMSEGLDLLGYIAFGFEPVFVPGKGWRIARNYTPDNIRQTVRW